MINWKIAFTVEPVKVGQVFKLNRASNKDNWGLKPTEAEYFMPYLVASEKTYGIYELNEPVWRVHWTVSEAFLRQHFIRIE